MIKMDRMTVIVAVSVILLSAAVPLTVVSTASNSESIEEIPKVAFEKVNFYVYFSVTDMNNLLPNESDPMVGGGSTLPEIMTSAFTNSDTYSIELLSTGAVKSVNGIIPNGNESWVVFQWLPPSGWVPTIMNSSSDSTIVENTSFLVAKVGKNVTSGTTTYDVPDVEGPVSEAFFFLKCETERFNIKAEQLGEGKHGTDLLKRLNDGFWIKGSGTSVSEAFIDACRTTFAWEYPVDGDGSKILRVPVSRCGSLTADQCIGLEIGTGEGSTIDGWLGVFLGLKDVTVPNGYIYWNQYNWSDISYGWDYNDQCLGYYDPMVTKYMGLIYCKSDVGGVPGSPFKDVDPYDAEPIPHVL